MKIGIYGVFDTVSRSWVLPLRFERNDDAAMRSFVYDIEQNNFLTAHAKDYELFWLGNFDDEKGRLTNVAEETDFDVNQVCVMTGEQYVQSKKDEKH